jgi:hypothetical protein
MFSWSADFHGSFLRDKTPDSTTGFKEGDESIVKFCRTVMNIPGYKPYGHQIAIINNVLNMALGQFYRKEFQKNYSAVLQRFNVLRNILITSATIPRQEGKSTAVQMIAAALALTVPTRKEGRPYGIGIVSINLKGTYKMIQDIENMLTSINYPGVRIEKTADLIIVYFPDGRFNFIKGFQTGEVRIFVSLVIKLLVMLLLFIEIFCQCHLSLTCER